MDDNDDDDGGRRVLLNSDDEPFGPTISGPLELLREFCQMFAKIELLWRETRKSGRIIFLGKTIDGREEKELLITDKRRMVSRDLNRNSNELTLG